LLRQVEGTLGADDLPVAIDELDDVLSRLQVREGEIAGCVEIRHTRDLREPNLPGLGAVIAVRLLRLVVGRAAERSAALLTGGQETARIHPNQAEDQHK